LRADDGPRPGLARLLVSSWLWHFTRWGGLFCCSYLVARAVAAPFLNQLVGAVIFAPMLLGAVAGGISERLDRRQVTLRVQLALIPVMFLMSVLVDIGRAQVWMVFPFMLALGIGGLVNMTAQRGFLADLAGPQLAVRAMAMDAVGLASASMAGAFVCGAVIGAFGLGAAFGLLAAVLCASAVVLPRHDADPLTRQAPAVSSWRDDLGRSIDLARRSRPIASMLGITVIFNVCYFSFVPLVPVLAKHFGVGATATGALGAAAGLGSLLAGLVLASRTVVAIGRVYVVGTGIALAGLAVFAFAPLIAIGFATLLIAGAGSAGFSSMQGGLAVEAAGRDERALALGLVSMAIGALPIGMLLLGVSAQLLGARLALLISAVSGLVLTAAWLWRYPEVVRQMLVPSAETTPATGSRPARR
jgi:MFS family permease